MSQEADGFWGVVLGGLFGAAIASPKKEDKDELNQYRLSKQRLLIRINALGKLPNVERIRTDPIIEHAFIESVNMFIYGFYRGSTIYAASLMEYILRKRLKNSDFSGLIDAACENGIISKSEVHYLHGLRLDRNELVHDLTRQIREEDAELIIKIVIKILNKLL
ncbi:MAG: hypothetical protein CVT49_01685 [candidate division Zixibacteria bacterium HGW-Zixibacteria-1]|nr:MAG: hypothetical protein CVT49_01685 [candidate division Zixibacteria bacterium HGW-Zixibacteria-1]